MPAISAVAASYAGEVTARITRVLSDAFVILAGSTIRSSVGISAVSSRHFQSSRIASRPSRATFAGILCPQIFAEQLQRQPAVVADLLEQMHHAAQIEMAVARHHAVFVVLLGAGRAGRAYR